MTVSTGAASVGGVDAEGDGGVEDPGAVAVDRQAVAAGGAGHRLRPRPAGHGTPPAGMWVFSMATRLSGGRWWAGPSAAASTAAGSNDALPVVERADLHAGVQRGGGRLVLADVGPGGAEHLGPRPGQEAEGDLVAHRPGRDVERRLLAHHGGGQLLQPVDRRVLAVDVVADLGVGHGPAHRRRGRRDRVGAQVDPPVGRRHGAASSLLERRAQPVRVDRPDQPFLDDRDGQRPVAAEDAALGQAPAAGRRRAGLAVEQPLVGPERAVEPHGVVEAGHHDVVVGSTTGRGARAPSRAACSRRRRRRRRCGGRGRRAASRRPGSTRAAGPVATGPVPRRAVDVADVDRLLGPQPPGDPAARARAAARQRLRVGRRPASGTCGRGPSRRRGTRPGG